MKYIAQKSLIWFLLILFSGMLFAQGEGYALTLNSDAENFVCCHRTNWNLGGSDGMTVSAWVRWSIVPSESDHYWANIISNNSVTHNDIGQFWLQHDMENELFEFAVSADSRRWIYGTTVPQKDVWYHVVGIYNDNAANSMQIWVNGVMENEINTLNGNISAFSSNYITKIGRWSSSSESRSFDGSIDEVSIWSRALDSTEIQSLKNNTLPADTSGLEAYWDFNTGHDDILQDQSG